VPVGKKTPASILNFVKEASGQVKAVFKTLSWQESQKKSLLEHRMMFVRQLEKDERKVSEEIARVEEQLQNRKAVLKKQEEHEAMLKAELDSLSRGGVEGGRGGDGRQREIGHQGQPWKGGPAQGLSPGGARSSAFNRGPMQSLSPGAGLLPSPCFYNFLARTTFVLESLPEAKNPGQDAFLGDFVFNSSYSRDNSLLD